MGRTWVKMTVEFKLESSWTTYPLIFFNQRKGNEEVSLTTESQTSKGLSSRVREGRGGWQWEVARG